MAEYLITWKGSGQTETKDENFVRRSLDGNYMDVDEVLGYINNGGEVQTPFFWVSKGYPNKNTIS